MRFLSQFKLRLETENKTVSTYRFQDEVLDYQCHAKGRVKPGVSPCNMSS